MAKITQKRLKEVLAYNPLTGVFTWKVKKKGSRKNNIAGSLNKEGYVIIKIDYTSYRSHRLSWLYMTGEWPDTVDHINHIRKDNRHCNIRSVKPITNSRNRRMNKNNTSGVVGVNWNPINSRWRSRIKVDGVDLSLGTFVGFHEAVNARKNAEVLYNFHENHGSSL